ncbi:hypothetical protein NXS19_011707 [Fusarium pseudograminearum]|nr:hypothetical protein NXS19_011707 [Fusarium pseudograminearum]
MKICLKCRISNDYANVTWSSQARPIPRTVPILTEEPENSLIYWLVLFGVLVGACSFFGPLIAQPVSERGVVCGPRYIAAVAIGNFVGVWRITIYWIYIVCMREKQDRDKRSRACSHEGE